MTDVRASGENTGGGEVKENLIDGESGTKWLAFEPTGWVEFDLDEPVKVVTYALTSANDHDERDPKDWTLQGSADGKDWQDLDSRTGQTFTERFQTKSYDFISDTAYRHFRLRITKNNGASDATQLADVQFSDGDTSTPAPDEMRSQADRGPSGSPTAKAGAGFSGKRALRYAGTHKADGRAYSYNKVFDVNTAVTRDTSLSYLVYPQMGETDLSYPATHVSVDLAFTDGTYLSDLRATDSNGGLLTPQGQADAKRLYVNQWNKVESTIGTVAAGRTVDRILVAYDSPKGTAKFQGWIDDIEIAPKAAEKRRAHLSDYASTVRGTNSSGAFSRGNNFPATAVPNGFNFWTPVTSSKLDELAVRLRAGQQRRQPAHPPGLQRQPRTEPLDGGPSDLPADALDGQPAPRTPPQGACAAVPPRERDCEAALLRCDIRQRSQGRDDTVRPCGPDAVHLPR